MRMTDESFTFLEPQNVTQVCSKLIYFIRMTMLYELVVEDSR